MPLAGIRWRDREGVQEAPLGDFLFAAQNDPGFAVPYPIAASLVAQDARPSEGVSVTQLLGGCIRCAVLQRFENYTESVEDLWHRWRGTGFHRVMEENVNPGWWGEVRFFTEVPGLGLLHGKPDMVNPFGVIADGKTTERIPMYGPWGNHAQQLQYYRWLINHAQSWGKDSFDGGEYKLEPFELEPDPRSVVFQRLFVYYIDSKGCKPVEIRRKTQVATKPGAKNPYRTVYEPGVWTDEEVEADLIPKYDELQSAFTEYEQTRRLPAFPPGFDIVGSWEHRYSPTAGLCVRRYIEEQAA